MLTMRDRYNIEIDNENWPKGMTDDDKERLRAACYQALLDNPKGLELHVVARHPEVERQMRRMGAVVLGWQYAAIHRALLAIPTAEERWVLVR